MSCNKCTQLAQMVLEKNGLNSGFRATDFYVNLLAAYIRDPQSQSLGNTILQRASFFLSSNLSTVENQSKDKDVDELNNMILFNKLMISIAKDYREEFDSDFNTNISVSEASTFMTMTDEVLADYFISFYKSNNEYITWNDETEVSEWFQAIRYLSKIDNKIKFFGTMNEEQYTKYIQENKTEKDISDIYPISVSSSIKSIFSDSQDRINSLDKTSPLQFKDDLIKELNLVKNEVLSRYNGQMNEIKERMKQKLFDTYPFMKSYPSFSDIIVKKIMEKRGHIQYTINYIANEHL